MMSDEHQHHPLLSIVTVCRNALPLLARTIESVAENRYPHLEHIVIDGASTDGTVELLKSVGEPVRYWVSEQDDGIYDAMNKGVVASCGSYVLMLNAGDCIARDDVLLEALEIAMSEAERPDIIVGKIRFVHPALRREWIWPRSYSVGHIGKPHQATLVHRDVYRRHKYSTAYRISGDFEYWNRLHRDECYRECRVDLIISENILGGISNNGRYEYRKFCEDLRIARVYGFATIRYVGVKALKTIVKIAASRILSERRYTQLTYMMFDVLPRYLRNA